MSNVRPTELAATTRMPTKTADYIGITGREDQKWLIDCFDGSYSMTRMQCFDPRAKGLVPYIILATVMNPVGLVLKFLGAGAIVVTSLTTSSGSAFGTGAVSSCPVVVGTAVLLFVDVGALTVPVAVAALTDSVTNDVYADAVLRSMSSLMKTRISCTGGFEGAG